MACGVVDRDDVRQERTMETVQTLGTCPLPDRRFG
jgi:hypothetical protein